MRIFIFFCISFFLLTIINSQESFHDEFDSLNPIKKNITVSPEEKLKIYKNFLDSALETGDQRNVFFGYLFMLSDKMRNQDYVSANVFLIKADSVAENSQNKRWIGHMMHRKAIMATRLNDSDSAFKWYMESVAVCGDAKDSLCVAEAYEQLSYLYGIKNNIDTANYFYIKSISLFKRHGSEKSLATAYNNFAIINTMQGNVLAAIPLYKSAIMSFGKLNMVKEKTKAMNNLADAYRNSHQFNNAKELLTECIKVNKKEELLENLYVNYKNLSAVFDSIQDYKSSLYYLVRHYELKDSLIGLETQTKIAEINSKYELKEKEMLIIENELVLKKETEKSRLKTFILICFILISGLIFSIFYKRISNMTYKLLKNKKEIISLEIKNEEKSNKINELEELVLSFKAMIYQKPENELEVNSTNIYHTILTNEDWLAFKSYFSNKYPGYINHLRLTHAHLTEAEERLFLLIKLNLSTKEIASILGIATESVKKTRSRLRKKLGIDEDTKLDTYIFEFNL